MVFVASAFRFGDSCRTNITVPRASSISMMLSHPNKRQRLLTNLARLLFLTTLEKQANELEIFDAAVSINMFEETKQAMKILREAMNSICCIDVADLRDIEELHEAGAGDERAE